MKKCGKHEQQEYEEAGERVVRKIDLEDPLHPAQYPRLCGPNQPVGALVDGRPTGAAAGSFDGMSAIGPPVLPFRTFFADRFSTLVQAFLETPAFKHCNSEDSKNAALPDQ